MLTPKQMEVFTFLDQSISKSGVCPSYREIAKACNLTSISNISFHINSLEARGFIRKIPFKKRAIEILKKPANQKETEFVVTDEMIEVGRTALSEWDFRGYASDSYEAIEGIYLAMRRAE